MVSVIQLVCAFKVSKLNEQNTPQLGFSASSGFLICLDLLRISCFEMNLQLKTH